MPLMTLFKPPFPSDPCQSLEMAVFPALNLLLSPLVSSAPRPSTALPDIPPKIPLIIPLRPPVPDPSDLPVHREDIAPFAVLNTLPRPELPSLPIAVCATLEMLFHAFLMPVRSPPVPVPSDLPVHNVLIALLHVLNTLPRPVLPSLPMVF